MRAVSRLVGLAGRLADDKAWFAMLRLIVKLSLLADALAELRDSQQRIHQARAARTAARLLRAAADAPTGPPLTVTMAGTAPLTGPPTSPSTSPRGTRRQAPPSTVHVTRAARL